jgi:prepilin signal peptidase PulO-like enzyme (type II secretory pathway)
MDVFTLFVLFVFGLLIGSFLNVVILRFDTGKSIAKGRSVCFSCGKALTWFELVPLFSFIFQKGRCRGCKSRISWQYPLVELLAALAFPLAYTRASGVYDDPYSMLAFLFLSILLCLYIVIAVYDLRHKIIPDVFSYAAAFTGIALILVDWRATGQFEVSRLLAGVALFLFFFTFWFFSKGKWMGLGDGKLALSVGFTLGLSAGAASLLLSFWIGAFVSILIILLQKARVLKGGLGFKSEVPFGPFILLGFLLSFIFGLDMQSILSFLTV